MIPPDHPTGSPAEEDHEINAYLAIAAAPCAISPVTGVMLARSGKLGARRLDTVQTVARKSSILRFRGDDAIDAIPHLAGGGQ